MVRDYLAIQGSSVPLEQVFSGGGLTGTRLRGQLMPELFEALQILKSAYRNGHIKATEQASAAIEIMEILDDKEDKEW